MANFNISPFTQTDGAGLASDDSLVIFEIFYNNNGIIKKHFTTSNNIILFLDKNLNYFNVKVGDSTFYEFKNGDTFNSVLATDAEDMFNKVSVILSPNF